MDAHINKKILKKQKEQKEKEEQSKEAIEVEEEKTTLEKKLLSFPVKEALEVFADAVPASVSSQRKQVKNISLIRLMCKNCRSNPDKNCKWALVYLYLCL